MNGMNAVNGTALNVVSKTYDDKTPMPKSKGAIRHRTGSHFG